MIILSSIAITIAMTLCVDVINVNYISQTLLIVTMKLKSEYPGE